MSHSFYSRITIICILILLISVFYYDRASYGWQVFIGFCASIFAMVLGLTYLYNQNLIGNSDKEDEALSADDSMSAFKDQVEEDIKCLIEQSRMSEADFIKWTDGIYKGYVEKKAEEDEGDDDLL